MQRMVYLCITILKSSGSVRSVKDEWSKSLFFIRAYLHKMYSIKQRIKKAGNSPHYLYALMIFAKESRLDSSHPCENNSATISITAHCLRGCCSFSFGYRIVLTVYHIIECFAIGISIFSTEKDM